MGADWYYPFVMYGCIIEIPDDTTFTKFLKFLQSISSPFKIDGMIYEIHSRMEGMSDDEYDNMTDDAVICIGFYPSGDFTEDAKKAEELSVYLKEDVMKEYSFQGPKFHVGFDWEGNPCE
jgi:hypothetical protein